MAVIKTKQLNGENIYQVYTRSNGLSPEYETRDAGGAEKYCENYYGCNWSWDTKPQVSKEQIFDDLTREYGTSVREYFMVLRLAIYHITGDYLEKSYEIAQYDKSDEVYRSAIRILKVLKWGRR